MKPFEYLSGFLILFQVVTISELTFGVAYSLNHWPATQFHATHSLIILCGFLGSLDYVIRVYSYRKVKAWNFWNFLLAILPGTCWLIVSKLVFPEIDPPAAYDFAVIFVQNRTLIFVLSGVYLILVSIPSLLIYRSKHRVELISFTAAGILFIVVGFLKAGILDNIIIMTLLLSVIVVHIYRNPKLSAV